MEELRSLIHTLQKLLFPEYFGAPPDPIPAECAPWLPALPHIRALLLTDLQAALEGDPAAESPEEVILAYPGFFAVMVHRLAHVLCRSGMPLLPRRMSEYAHSVTGIDIHPGAVIGSHFFIDHGTGVVIGQTAVIGSGVRLYQGVTLGGISTRNAPALKNTKRHPTVEDNVTVYANATVLGGDTVIGAGSVIGANVLITQSVAPNTQVSLDAPALRFRTRTG